jgi:hypothetical protein
MSARSQRACRSSVTSHPSRSTKKEKRNQKFKIQKSKERRWIVRRGKWKIGWKEIREKESHIIGVVTVFIRAARLNRSSQTIDILTHTMKKERNLLSGWAYPICEGKLVGGPTALIQQAKEGRSDGS